MRRNEESSSGAIGRSLKRKKSLRCKGEDLDKECVKIDVVGLKKCWVLIKNT